MHKALSDNNLGLLCFLNILGGHWNTKTATKRADSVMDVFLYKINFKGLDLRRVYTSY